jgi:hypothetical protein
LRAKNAKQDAKTAGQSAVSVAEEDEATELVLVVARAGEWF